MIKVLIADDFPIIREDIKEKLEQDPEIAVIGCAGSGKEIEKLALSLDADIILMDIEMETMNAGILATERIRDQRPDQKIIYLTAHETEKIIITAMGTGAVDYIVKGGPDQNVIDHIKAAYAG